MGGDTSGKTSTTRAGMDQNSTQDVWGEQSPFLTNMYQQGQDLTGQGAVNDRAVDAYQRFGNRQPGQVYDPAQSGYQQAFGAGSAAGQAGQEAVNPMMSGLAGLANQDPSQAFAAGGNNPLLDNYVANTLTQASENFNRNIAPGIGRDAQSMGQFGGSRGDLALGTAAGDANQDAMNAAMQMYQQQYQGDRSANLASAAQMGQTALGANEQLGNLVAGQGTNATQGIGAGADLQNLGMGQGDVFSQANMQQWAPLLQQSGILGSPLVLGETTSTSSSASDPIIKGAGDIPTPVPGK